ncbi:MAG: hypothetical protein FWG47_01385 [Propionibacteriaceae bacterium]|nr:hypothetical protein [Propionibacteriaceae bacterium]
MISQLTVFIENKKGHLANACRAIANAGINMHALFLADTADFGIARIFCDRPNFATQALRDAGFRAKITPVLAVRIPDHKGCLADLLEFLDSEDVNIEYGYCYSANNGYAIDVLKVSGDEVEERLTLAGYQLVAPNEIYELD